MIKRKLLQLITITFLLLLCLISSPFAEECSDVYSALVFEDKNGDVMFEKRADQIIYPASLTKLMTAYLAFEAVKEGKITTNQFIVVSDRAEEISSINRITTIKLQKGDMISVIDAIEGSIIKSFNEAAVMLAEIISGSEWKFSRLMNKKAKELGMYQTNFRNSSGLHDDGHFTTNRDLSKLVTALKQDFPEYYYIFSRKKFKFNGFTFTNHNDFLFNYKGAKGMKTGFTLKSGYSLIATARRNRDKVTSILTSCASSKKRSEFTIELLDYAFAKINFNRSNKTLK